MINNSDLALSETLAAAVSGRTAGSTRLFVSSARKWYGAVSIEDRMRLPQSLRGAPPGGANLGEWGFSGLAP